MSIRPLRVALVADLLSEQWPSMNLVADTLTAELATVGSRAQLEVELVRPVFAPRHEPIGRYLNRFVDFSWWLWRHRPDADVFHVIDHSYAHLVHVLPAGKVVVTCHDTDAFLSLVAPEHGTSRLPKSVTRVVLSGMRKAAHVTCDSHATRDEMLRLGLMPADRLSVVHMGVHPGIAPQPDDRADAELTQLLGARLAGVPELLHVGTCIPRKRIDVLLTVLAAVVETNPRVRLLRAGGRLTEEQRALAVRLGVDRHVVQLPYLETPLLAALYRRADVLLLTSDREGFGLPMAEALACGTPVIGSDIPVYREVGGQAANYAPVGETLPWRNCVQQVLARERDQAGRELRRASRVSHAARFSWSTCAESLCRVYESIGRRLTMATTEPVGKR